MGRPQKNRIVEFSPGISYFKPRGIPLHDLEEIQLTVDEVESIRLADLLNMTHEEAGCQMGVSRATFGRIVENARALIADALINGKAIKIEGGNFKMMDQRDERSFKCINCNHDWNESRGTGRPDGCPKCQENNFYRCG
ncbi:MAG: DNA-binding protein [Candidatus Magnetoglobus multicellularis str. Araruama]|uniref:UPF0251 protein OMM_07504 n=1 Tax=Candidatus Magnetoglobus multicellularis str. Araruama TaxID=890399 RepID=A0A1V1PCD6_9BACT|nr:MAG: DNA-binding protein [Candidatus Magnetoglobus multicellularis str. Araruama]